MKIGIIHTAYQQQSGEDQVVQTEFDWLSRQGYAVTQLLFSNAGSAARNVFNYLMAPFNPAAYRRVCHWLAEEKPDVVHIHNWHFSASPAVIAAAQHKGVPVVMTLHNFRLICPSAFLFHDGRLFLDSLKAPFPWRAVLRRVYRQSVFQTFWLSLTVWLHRRWGTWRKVNRYIVFTEDARSVFLSSSLGLTREQIEVKPNFAPAVQADPRPRANHFLYVGRLSAEKGIATLLEAFRISAHSLIIAGDGPLRSVVEQAARQYPNIVYKGPRPKAEILREIQQCSALIFSSLWYEGFPLVLAEALSCGTPVIASRLGAAGVIIQPEQNGLHFNAGDAADLQAQLDRWHGLDTQTRAAFSARALQTFENEYTQDKNMRRLTSIYQSVCEAAGAKKQNCPDRTQPRHRSIKMDSQTLKGRNTVPQAVAKQGLGTK